MAKLIIAQQHFTYLKITIDTIKSFAEGSDNLIKENVKIKYFLCTI